MTALKKLYLDIEVCNPPNKFPFADKAAYPVIAITTYDASENRFYSFLVADADIAPKSNNWHVSVFSSERAMLTYFKRKFEQLDPDVILAWNIAFDYLYVQNRLKRLGIDQIEERFQILDLLGAYKQVKKGGVSSYNLKDVERQEGIKRKLPESIAKDIREFYEAGEFRHILLYNKEDVEGIVKLDNKLQLSRFFLHLREVIGLERFVRGIDEDKNPTWQIFHNSVLVDTFMFFLLKHKNIILPTKGRYQSQSKGSQYKGAIVFASDPGIYTNVANLDMSKFYPSILLSLNLSPEITKNNANRQGIIPFLLKHLIEERTKIETERAKYDPQSTQYRTLTDKRQVIKELINSVYGFVAFKGSRLYSDIGAKVTEIGRKGLSFVRQEAEWHGMKVIYGDTDGIFCVVQDGTTHEQIAEIANEITHKFDVFFESLEPFTQTHYFKLDYDLFFSKLLLLTKKRYAGLVTYEDGKSVNYIKTRGIETRRGNAPLLTKRLQEKVLEYIFNGSIDAIPPLIEKLRDVINGFEFNGKNYHVVDAMAIPMGLQQPLNYYGGVDKNGNKKGIPPHVRAAVIANRFLGKNFDYGSKIKTLYVHSMRLPEPVALPSGEKITMTDVIGYEDVSELVRYKKLAERARTELSLDKDRMFNVVVSDKIQPILDAISDNSIKQKTILEW